jgi:poly(3-hydroxybutyrate) depolymerase
MALRLVRTSVTASEAAPAGLVHRMLADMVLDRAGGSPDAVAAVPAARLHSPLMEFAELAAGADPVRPYGFVRLAWMDAIDDSPQFCRAYLPAGYDPARAWPMIVNLHGYNPPNPPYVRWWGVDQRHNGMADEGFIVIEPHGRGNTFYAGIGEADVLRAVDAAKARFNVDAARVYLMGYSMGGAGTWTVGTRNVDIFAAIAPVFGGWDTRLWMDAGQVLGLTPVRRLMAEREASFAQAETLLSTPVFVNHGDADPLVPADQSRHAVRMLQRWGYPVRYWEHPGKGHGGLGCEAAILDFFRAHALDPHPLKVSLRSPDLAGARAHWLTVTARDDPLALITAQARIIGPNRVRLDTANALAVTIAPGGEFIDPAQPLRVVWNGSDVRMGPMTDGRLALLAPGYEPAPRVKRAGLEGPIRTVTERPFAIVLGTTSPDPRMRRMCERLAQREVLRWRTWQHAAPRYFRDTDLGPDDAARHSLILIGGPAENAVTRSLAGGLPLEIEADRVRIGDRTFTAPGAAVRVIAPHPANAERMVAVTAATSADGMFLADDLPEDVDFVIRDARIAPEDDARATEQTAVAAGWFDGAWRVSGARLIVGDAEARSRAPVRRVPALAAASEAAGPRVALDDVLESAASGSFARMRRGCNWRYEALRIGGRTFAGGLSVRYEHEPSWGEWNIESGGWQRLRATIGIQTPDPATLEDKERESTAVEFIVWGDGKELHRSEPFHAGDGPRLLDIDVRGIKVLRLEVTNRAQWFCAADSVNWADVRLER